VFAEEGHIPRLGILIGALCGALVTAALVAILFLAYALAGLPFVPFQLFDRAARTLPGSVIRFGIDTMVSVIRGLQIGETSSVAKTAEQTMAIGGCLLVGTVAGALLFAIGRPRSGRGRAPGIVLGLLVGVPAAWIAATVEQPSSARPIVGAAWVLLAFVAWGLALVWIRDRIAIPVTTAEGIAAAEAVRLDRRHFLVRVGGATATITIAGAALGTLLTRRRVDEAPAAGALEPWSTSHRLPNVDASVAPAKGTRPELTPLADHYRIDIDTTPPAVSEHNWRLKIGGLVRQPTELTLAQLRAYEPLHQFVTLACISNPVGGDLIGTTRWTGVSLGRLLKDIGLQPGATHLRIRSVDGFFEVVPLDVVRADERVMLTYAWDGLPLARPHGFPLRIYIPDHYGMKQPKWIDSIHVIDAWEPGYWVHRGWDREARMRATAVIDTIAMNMMIIDPAKAVTIPIGGIAHAGARGISRVEASVDGGPWEPALLRDPISPTTWVIWRYDWLFRPGKHTFTVRCFEGDGTPQIAEESPPSPSGATGLNRVTRTL
jgi:DMSO/TMAO reductase YedYZ molybdopterin-dependent catalytic subunit